MTHLKHTHHALVLVLQDVAMDDHLAHEAIGLKLHVHVVVRHHDHIVPVARREIAARGVGGVRGELGREIRKRLGQSEGVKAWG